MTDIKIIPQKFTFEQPTVTNGQNEIVSNGIKVSIDIDTMRADKQLVKADLETIFAEVLEYFKIE